MMKKTLSLLALSLCLSLSTNAMDTDHSLENQLSCKRSFGPNQWWDDYKHSKKPICQYVANIAIDNQEAAKWFLMTGGKYGFAHRKATEEETGHILKAILQVNDYIQKSPLVHETRYITYVFLYQWNLQKKEAHPYARIFYNLLDLEEIEILEQEELLKKNEDIRQSLKGTFKVFQQ